MMKLVFVAFVCFAYQQASTQFVGLNNCPKATSGNPKPPAAGKYYQVVRFKLSNLPEIPKCRNFKLTVNANKSLLISQSVVGPFEVVLNQTFIAKANASGYWDVSENAIPSSSIFLDVSSAKSTIVYTCKHEAIMPFMQGVYSQSKTLPADEMKRVTDALKRNNVTQFETVTQSACKN